MKYTPLMKNNLFLIIILFSLLNCNEDTEEVKSHKTEPEVPKYNIPKELYSTEWKNGQGISVIFDSTFQIYVYPPGYMVSYFFEINSDTLNILNAKRQNNSPSTKWSSRFKIETLKHDSLVLTPLKIVHKNLFKDSSKITLLPENAFHNSNINMTGISFKGGWNPNIEFNLRNDSLEFYKIWSYSRGDNLHPIKDTLAFKGLVPSKIKDDLMQLVQLTTSYEMEQSYGYFSHFPSYSFSISYNGVTKKTGGSNFSRSLNKIRNYIFNLDEMDIKMENKY